MTEALSSIYARYVTSKKEEKERDPLRLFISDIGKCPRSIAYRMFETEKDEVLPQTIINKAIMFDLAEYMEHTLKLAFEQQGIEVEYQFEIPMEDFDNWGGRGDIIADYGGRRIIEVKTVHPNAFKFGLDYPEHTYQAAAYDLFCAEKYKLSAAPLLVYFDRGGQNTPVEKVVDYEIDTIMSLIGHLEDVRYMLPELPEKLGKVLKERNYKKNLVREPDYRCNYCDYAGTCMPDMSTQVWASREKNDMPYTAKRVADPEVLAVFIDTLNPMLEDKSSES